MNRSALSVVPARGLCLTLVLGATTVAVLTAPPALAGSTVIEKFDLTPTPAALEADPEVESDARTRVRTESQDFNVVYTTEEEQSLTMSYTTVDGAGTRSVHDAGTVVTGDMDPDPLAEENGAEWWLDTDPSHCAADAEAFPDWFECGALAGDVRTIVLVEVTDAAGVVLASAVPPSS